jgi:hypothetical protein
VTSTTVGSRQSMCGLLTGSMYALRMTASPSDSAAYGTCAGIHRAGDGGSSQVPCSLRIRSNPRSEQAS